MGKEQATKLTIALPVDLKSRVKAKAEREGRNVTDIIMEAFANYLHEDNIQEQIDELRKRLDEMENKK